MHGGGGAHAGRNARPLRPLDPRPRGRDLLLRLRRPVGALRGVRRRARRPRPDPDRRGGLVRTGCSWKGADMKSRWLLVVALVAIGAAVYGGKVLATPATTPGFSGTTLAKATLGDLDIKAQTSPADIWKLQLKTKGDSDLYVQQNTWDPSLCGGWIPRTRRATPPRAGNILVTPGGGRGYERDEPTPTPP